MGRITIIGGGLAGSEAAWQAARRGAEVVLHEMRPGHATPAHKTGLLAELVCSNSFRAEGLANAVGLLKEELRHAGSLIMAVADETRVPAGGALAVDRTVFAEAITARIKSEPRIEVRREEIREIPEPVDGPVIIATGPLTSDALAEELKKIAGSGRLYFYDAIAPIVEAETIRWDRVYKASRYGKGGDDYVNCPMTREEYDSFYNALMSAEKAPTRNFEEERVFEGCMPIEILASRGYDTPRFGPMKPVGLPDPRTGREPYAVVQLRPENRHMTAFNMVGFQTKLKWPEQARVFGMIPGLEEAEFLRFGSLHRNTYLCSPRILNPDLTLRDRGEGKILLAGQISGVEGYVESTAMGWLAGVNAVRILGGEAPLVPSPKTAHGGLITHITSSDPDRFQPSNVNFGLLPPLTTRIRNKKERYEKISERAITAWDEFLMDIA